MLFSWKQGRLSYIYLLIFSAKDRINIQEAFIALVREIRRHEKEFGYKVKASTGATQNAGAGHVDYGPSSQPSQEGACCVIL